MVALMDVLQFDTLDISLQDEFDKFLQERGIHQTLAYFVPEYAEYKEQKVCFRVWLLQHRLLTTCPPTTGICQLAEERQGFR